MTLPVDLRQAKENWHLLAERHLEAALELLAHAPHLTDCAMFHVYHAYECIACALIAANHCLVPPQGGRAKSLGSRRRTTAYNPPGGDTRGPILSPSIHDARLQLMERIIHPSHSYFAAYRTLSTMLVVALRHEMLYYDWQHGLMPHQQAFPDPTNLLLDVAAFVRDIWNDIQSY